MGRKEKQTVDYFPHFCKHKKTMYIIERQFGNDGYALWFKTLELLGQSDGHFIDCGNSDEWEYYASYCGINAISAAEILDKLAHLGAIDKELWKNRIIWSDNFIDGIKEVYKKRKADLPKKPIYSGINDISDTGNAISDGRKQQSRVEYSKVEYSKVNNDIEAPPKKTKKESPELNEVINFFTINGSTKPEAELFFHHYETKNWEVESMNGITRDITGKWTHKAMEWIKRTEIGKIEQKQKEKGNGNKKFDFSNRRKSKGATPEELARLAADYHQEYHQQRD